MKEFWVSWKIYTCLYGDMTSPDPSVDRKPPSIWWAPIFGIAGLGLLFWLAPPSVPLGSATLGPLGLVTVWGVWLIADLRGDAARIAFGITLGGGLWLVPGDGLITWGGIFGLGLLCVARWIQAQHEK